MKEQTNIIYNKNKLIKVFIFTLIFIIGFTWMFVNNVMAYTTKTGGYGGSDEFIPNPSPPPSGGGDPCCSRDGNGNITFDGGCCDSSSSEPSYYYYHSPGNFIRNGYRFTVKCKNEKNSANGHQITIPEKVTNYYGHDEVSIQDKSPNSLASKSWNDIRFYYINEEVILYLLGVKNNKSLNDYIDCAILVEPIFNLGLPYNSSDAPGAKTTYYDLYGNGTATEEPKYNKMYSIKEFLPHVETYARLYAKHGYTDSGFVSDNVPYDGNLIYSNIVGYGPEKIYDKSVGYVYSYAAAFENQMRIYKYLTTALTYGTSNKACYSLTTKPPQDCFAEKYKITSWLSTDYYHGWILLKDYINTAIINVKKESKTPGGIATTQSLSGAQFVLMKEINGKYQNVKIDSDGDWIEYRNGKWYKIKYKTDSNDNLVKITNVKELEEASSSPIDYIVTTTDGLAQFKVKEIGNYKIHETNELKDHDKEEANKKLATQVIKIEGLSGKYDKTITVTNIYGKKYEIEKKDKDTNQLIENGSATFDIYSDSTCDNSKRLKSVTTYKGKASIMLTPGSSYYIKETNAPMGYIKNETCIKLNSSGTTVVYNESNCVDICNKVVGGPNDTMDNRIWAYRHFYSQSSKNYNKFLDLNNTTCSDICNGPKNCDAGGNNISTNCLSGKYDSDKANSFSPTDISCYNSTSTTTSPNAIAYCLVSFKLDNKLGTSTFNVKSGMMPIQRFNISDAVATTGTLSRMCYIYSIPANENSDQPPSTYDTNRGELNDNYSNYIGNIYLDGKILKSTTPDVKKENTYNWYSYKATANYLLNPVYAEMGTGNISYSESNGYRLIGYGVVSKFNAKNQYSLPFKVNFQSGFPINISSEKLTSNACKVNPTQEVTKDDDKLNIEFRITDTSNPFPGATGTGRKEGSNWKAKNSYDLDGDGVSATVKDISALKSKIISGGIKTNGDLKYDVYPDGELNDKDVDYLEWLSTEWKNNKNYTNGSYEKALYSYVMSTTNNSYNQNKKEPKYTFHLTLDVIQKIRKYNVGKSYDDFKLSCDENGNCTNNDFFNYVGLDLN